MTESTLEYKRKLWQAVTALFIVFVILNLLSCAAAVTWMLELLTHFRVHYAWCALVFAVTFAVIRQPRRCLCALFVLGFNAICFWPYVEVGEKDKSNADSLRILSVNVHARNRQYERLVNLIETERPTLLLLVEFTDLWQAGLEELRKDYPYSISQPRNDNFGIALFSQYPIESYRIVELGESGIPSIVARVNWDQLSVTVIGTHPLPPLSGRLSSLRDQQVSDLAELVSGIPGPLVVMGDLNATPWSPVLTDFVAKTGLHDARERHGILSTWPAAFGDFGIPIDYILLSSEFRVQQARAGIPIGSDHLPLIADVTLTTD